MKKTNTVYLLFFVSFLLISSILTAQTQTSKITASGFHRLKQRRALCGTPVFNLKYTEEAARATKISDPEFFKKAQLNLKKISKSTAAVGDTLQFYAIDNRKGEFYTLDAILKAIGQKTQVWVEIEELNNGRVTDDIVSTILENLENTTPASSKDPTKGIVELENEYFGEPPNKDGDGLVDFLLLDIRDNYPDQNSYFAGYFTSNDQIAREGSNLRDILYIDTYPSLNELNDLLNNISHEYQHLIHYRYDQNEVTFINEGLSEYAQILTGYSLENPLFFFLDTNRGLTRFDPPTSIDVFTDYVKVQLWTLYLAEQLGDTFIKNLVQNPENGIPGITSLLSTVTPAITWDKLFKNWTLANILNDTSIDPAYGYYLPAAKINKASIHNSHIDYPVAVNNDNISGIAAKYSRFSDGHALEMSFDVQFVKITAIEISQNDVQFVDIDPSQIFKENKFGSTYREIIFCFHNPVDVEQDYSYTAIAEQSYFVRELKYDDGVNDAIYFTKENFPVNILWHGFNTSGSGWAVKFHPPNQNSRLMKMKFFGGTFETGDFEIRIYDDSGANNSPGKIIAPPKTLHVEESDYFQWLEVDFQDQAGFLTGFENDLYISIVSSSGDTGAIILAIDKLENPGNESWALFGPTYDGPGWKAFTELKVTTDQNDDVNLGDFTLMFRAEMTFVDEDEPVLTTGFLQHPVFTENIDIYVLGEKELALKNLTGKIIYSETEEDLEFSQSGTSGKVFVDNDIILAQNGRVDIYVEGTNKFGFITKDTTISFNVQGIITTTETKISTLDKKAMLIIPPFSITEKSKIIAYTGVLNQANMNADLIEKGIGEAVTFSPQKSLSGNAVLTIRFEPETIKNIENSTICIAQLENNKWIPLNSSIDKENNSISAYITSLGTFQIRVGQKGQSTIPLEYNLFQNYPNPFNPETSIRFSIKDNSFVTLKIYNTLGQEIKTLVSGFKSRGMHTEVWNGRDNNGNNVASGIYIYKLRTDNFSKALKLILTR